MSMIFEQTKDRYGKPSWFIFPHDKTGIHIGRVAWDADQYAFQPPVRETSKFTAAELREIAEFIDALTAAQRRR